MGSVDTQGGTAAEKTVTGAASFYADASITGSGANNIKVTNLYGLYVEARTLVGNSKLTNDYGIWIGDQAGGATLNYALYTNAGLVRFGDNVEIAGGFGMAAVTPQTQQAHIIDADGTLGDITTKFNTLLANLEGFGFHATS